MRAGSAPDADAELPRKHRSKVNFDALGTWTDRLTEPLVMRLPRGVAFLAVIGLLAMVLLAYWVGHVRGFGSGEAHVEEQARAALRQRVAPQPPTEGETVTQAPPGNADSQTIVTKDGVDPRQPGWNYLVVARYPSDKAMELRRFLAEHEVDTIQVPSDNPALVLIVALPGFESGQVAQRTAFRQRMLELGRQWWAFNANRGSDLRDMYYARYNG